MVAAGVPAPSLLSVPQVALGAGPVRSTAELLALAPALSPTVSVTATRPLPSAETEAVEPPVVPLKRASVLSPSAQP